jgi:hypothetical protein
MHLRARRLNFSLPGACDWATPRRSWTRSRSSRRTAAAVAQSSGGPQRVRALEVHRKADQEQVQSPLIPIQHWFETSNLGHCSGPTAKSSTEETVQCSFCGRGFYDRIPERGAGSASPKTETRQLLERKGHEQFRMNLYKTIAVAGLVLSVISSAALAAEPSTPAASVALPATTATPIALPATPSKIKATKKRFLLTHSSSVYEKPDKASLVIWPRSPWNTRKRHRCHGRLAANSTVERQSRLHTLKRG